MINVLIYHSGKQIKTYQFDKETITIGRLPTNDISINNISISRNHMILEYSSNEVKVSDRGSLNGIWCGKEKIESATFNQDVVLHIGDFTLSLEFNEQAESMPTHYPSEQEIQQPQQESITESGNVSKETGIYLRSSIHAMSDSYANRDPEKIEHSKAVLIEVNKQIIYKINKTVMTLGSNKNNDIYIESGVFSNEKIATIAVVNGSYELIAANKLMGRFKVNGKKVATAELKHKDKIEIGSSTFSFMIKDD